MFALKEAGERKFEKPGKQFPISLSLCFTGGLRHISSASKPVAADMKPRY